MRNFLEYEVNFLQVIAPSVGEHWEFFTFAQVPTCRSLASDLFPAPTPEIEFLLALLCKSGLRLKAGQPSREGIQNTEVRIQFLTDFWLLTPAFLLRQNVLA